MRVTWLSARSLLASAVAVHTEQSAPAHSAPAPPPSATATGISRRRRPADGGCDGRRWRGPSNHGPQAAEFTVEVDGRARPVVTAEYVKLADDTPMPVGRAQAATRRKRRPDEAFFSTNTRAVDAGPLILMLVDQGNIRVGQGRQMMRSAVKFVDGLDPNDRVALVAMPGRAHSSISRPTTRRCARALLARWGMATKFQGRFHISLSEAIATVEHSDAGLDARR